MDLRTYYKTIQDAEAQLKGEYVVTVSLATPEGGKGDVRTEAPRRVAAKLIAEGKARAATEEETKQFHEANRDALERHKHEEAARRVQVMVIPSHEMRQPKERS